MIAAKLEETSKPSRDLVLSKTSQAQEISRRQGPVYFSCTSPVPDASDPPQLAATPTLEAAAAF